MSEVDNLAVLNGNEQARVQADQASAFAEYGPPGTYDVHFGWDEQAKLWTGEPAKVVTRLTGRTKVALVGFSEAAKVGCPWDDESWEVVSLNQHWRHQKRASRWFEIHTREQYLSDQVPGTDYLKWLQNTPLPVYVTELFPDMPTAIKFPMEAVLDMGAAVWEERPRGWERRDYNQSSLSAMLGWALLEGFDTIGIWGVDLIIGTEYFYQKCNMEWLIGFAQGRGYTVTRGTKPRGIPRELFLPEASALLHQTYSYGPQTAGDNPLRPIMVDRQQAIGNGQKELVDTLNKIDGELFGNYQWIRLLESHARGETVKWTNADGTTRDVPPDPGIWLDLLRERQQHALKAKEQFVEQYQQAEGEYRDVTNWLSILEFQDRGARPKWRFVDGREEFIKLPRR